MNNVGAGRELYASSLQCLEYCLNVSHLEIDRGSSLAGLIRGENTHEQPDGARPEKAHLGRSRKEELEAERVAIERDCLIKVLHWNENLCDGRVREIHLASSNYAAIVSLPEQQPPDG